MNEAAVGGLPEKEKSYVEKGAFFSRWGAAAFTACAVRIEWEE